MGEADCRKEQGVERYTAAQSRGLRWHVAKERHRHGGVGRRGAHGRQTYGRGQAMRGAGLAQKWGNKGKGSGLLPPATASLPQHLEL